MIFFLLLISLPVIFGFAAEPNPPVWPSSVTVFSPTMDMQKAQSIIDQAFAVNGGSSPAFNGQFSNKRFAFLFEPGTYDLNVNVGYYTSVMGLGMQPSDTQISSVTSQNGDFDYSGGALSNFWRSAENFLTTPTQYWNGDSSPSMLWAVSQACPLRRVVVEGNLNLYQYNSGCCAGYSSGGYMADSFVSGSINSGTQQQFYTRNTMIGFWAGANWNMVFQGNTNGAPKSHCSNANGVPITTLSETPLIAEKPFITSNNSRYYLAVPPVEISKVGPTDYASAAVNIKQIDFSQVYVAKETDGGAKISAKLSEGLHVVLSPGNYNLTEPIVVSQPNQVLLGIGFPTLTSMAGNPVIVVQSEGARVASVLLQAGPVNAPTLLQWGNQTDTNKNVNSLNPGFLYDCFARVGGPNDPHIEQARTNSMVVIYHNHVVIDNAWLWRADHDITGSVSDSMNPVKHGLQVFGDNVVTYGLAVEHTLQDLTQWYGNEGAMFFYQSELPYDVSQAQFGSPGYASIRVGSSVSSFTAFAAGTYSYFRDYNVTVESAMVAPITPSVNFVNSLSVFLNGQGGIKHILNDLGNSVQAGVQVEYLC